MGEIERLHKQIKTLSLNVNVLNDVIADIRKSVKESVPEANKNHYHGYVSIPGCINQTKEVTA